jgi:2-polyprenyl-6-methoxyphenol hydroxylase-like FAD-dependent oxidoreductase
LPLDGCSLGHFTAFKERRMHHDRSQASNTSLHVLVVGGGIGGLCLAQGLLESNVSVAVYERDDSARFRGQGWRLGIKQDGSRALRECLPRDLFDLCVATSIRPALRMVFLDQRLRPSFDKPLPHEHDGPDSASFGVNRLTLREILLTGLDGIVHFGKAFERFEQLGDGRVRAHFADGTEASGDLLVGADGTGSAVRGQLVPDAEFDELGSFVYGRTPLTAATLSALPEALVDTFNRVSAPDGVAMSVVTCRTWEPPAEAAARLAPRARLTGIPDYLAWMLSGWESLGTLGERRFHAADGTTLHRLARRVLAGWPDPLRRLVEAADADATFPVRLRSARSVAPWRSSNVTLLGDAVHTMSPGRGDGANVTLRDAGLLRRALVDVASGGTPLAAAMARYEAEMLRYGFEAVADSLRRPFGPPRRPVTRFTQRRADP